MAVLPARPVPGLPNLNPDLLRRFLRAAARLAAGALIAVAFVSSAADDTVTLNFVNADIDAVVKAASEITGRNFILDPKIKGTINIVSARPVPRELVYPTLLSALRLQGIVAVEGNGVTKLVMEVDGKQQGSEVMRGPVSGSGDRLVTQVITLRYESALQLVNVLRPLITPNNTIAAYPGTNALIITDYADNLRRIDKIIASLDVPPSGEPVVVTLKYASAIDLVPLLNKLVGADTATAGGVPGDAQQRIMIVADPRSNSVLLRSENPGRTARIKAMIEQLDTPQRAGGNMFIVYLRNADAARVAQTLRALLSGGGDVTQTPNVPTQSMFGGQITAAAGSNAAGCRCGRRARVGGESIYRGAGNRRQYRQCDDPGRRREQRADHHGAGAGLQQPALDHRPARRAPRAGLCGSADRRGDFGQGGAVRHPVAGAAGSQQKQRAGLRWNQLRRGGQRQQHCQRFGESEFAGTGPQSRLS